MNIFIRNRLIENINNDEVIQDYSEHKTSKKCAHCGKREIINVSSNIKQTIIRYNKASPTSKGYKFYIVWGDIHEICKLCGDIKCISSSWVRSTVPLGLGADWSNPDARLFIEKYLYKFCPRLDPYYKYLIK